MNHPSPLVVGIALSLYGFNVSPFQRAQKLYDHFKGNCMELGELTRLMDSPRLAYAMTELPLPTACVYVAHAMDRYGEEALRRASSLRFDESPNF